MKHQITIILTWILGAASLATPGIAQDPNFKYQAQPSKQSAVVSPVSLGDDPPANDNFANALPIVIANGTGSVITNNIHATKEPGEPNHAENAGGGSVWFSITPTATTAMRINTVDTTFDTLLAVYTGNSVNGLQLIGHNDDCNSTCGGASTVDLMLNAGTTYYIAVDAYSDGGVFGQGGFKIALLESVPPFSDDLAWAYDLGSSHGGSIAGTNYNATRQVEEPEHVNSNYPGARSVWYKWKPSATFGASFELTESFDAQIAVYRSPTATPTFSQLTRVAWNVDSQNGESYSQYRVRFMAEAGQFYFIAVAGHSQNPHEGDAGNFQLKFRPGKMTYSMQLNPRSRRSAISVFRPSEGNWYSMPSLGSSAYGIRHWGLNGDNPFAADFDGDGECEYAVVRNNNGLKEWYVYTGLVPMIFHWGIDSDKVVVGDFDGDSRADAAVIRTTAQGYVWYVRQSLTGAMRTFVFGTTGDKPVLGDFDGDGRTEVAVVRNTQSGLVWYLLNSGSNNYGGFSAFQFGVSPDIPAVEDFDGDGKTDVAVFRPSTGVWYILQSGTDQVRIDAFGVVGDKPQPADYNGDGKADLAVFRPANSTWYIAKPAGVPAQNFHAIPWGTSTDIPVSSTVSLTQ